MKTERLSGLKTEFMDTIDSLIHNKDNLFNNLNQKSIADISEKAFQIRTMIDNTKLLVRESTSINLAADIINEIDQIASLSFLVGKYFIAYSNEDNLNYPTAKARDARKKVKGNKKYEDILRREYALWDRESQSYSAFVRNLTSILKKERPKERGNSNTTVRTTLSALGLTR